MILIPLKPLILGLLAIMFIEGFREQLPFMGHVIFIGMPAVVFYFNFRKLWR